jgi:hypothetical protein
MKSAKCFCKASVSAVLVPEALKLQAFLLLFFIGASGYSSSPVISYKPVLPPVALCKNITVRLGAGGTISISAATSTPDHMTPMVQ